MKPSGEKTTFAASFGYAVQGIQAAAKGRNFRIQAAVGLLALVLGVLLHISPLEWIVVLFCIGAVLGGESVNTAIEDVIDLSVKSFHPQAKRAKDIAAGAVLLMSVASLFIGIIIFLPRMWALIAG